MTKQILEFSWKPSEKILFPWKLYGLPIKSQFLKKSLFIIGNKFIDVLNIKRSLSHIVMDF